MRNKEVVLIGFVTFCELIVQLVTLNNLVLPKLVSEVYYIHKNDLYVYYLIYKKTQHLLKWRHNPYQTISKLHQTNIIIKFVKVYQQIKI